ncbi:MAG: glycosyltransferase [Chitinophagaceae bacterium]|nr:glycosyltransferase [Chitinophagaceae bacterium]
MPFFLLIFFLLLIGYAVLIGYYHNAWNKLPVYTPPADAPTASITVIIPARNEEANLPRLIDSLRQQQYPPELFEVIIIDDHSTDDTFRLLDEASKAWPALKLIRMADLPDNGNGSTAFKKKAIQAGIDQAKGTLIVTTDADCIFHQQWLHTIGSYYQYTGAKFIAAPVVIEGKDNLLNIFQSLDFLTLQGITGASVFKRAHSMCNGANLAYERSAFEEVNGFEKIDHLPSGDDMFLMHKIFKRYPDKVFYCKSPTAIVSTEPVHSWKAFIHQRIRWASKADSYDDKRIFWALLLVYLSNLGFLVLFIMGFWKPLAFFFCIILLLAKMLIEFPFVNSVAIFFGQQRRMKYFLLLQPIHILYTIIAGWLGKFGHYEWKGRKVSKR